VLQNAVRDSVARELELQRKLRVAEEALSVSQDGARRQEKEQASTSERAVTAAAAPPAEMTVVHLLSGTPGRCEYELKPTSMDEGSAQFEQLLLECQDSFPVIDVQRCRDWIASAEQTAVAQTGTLPEWTPNAKRAVDKLFAQQITTWRIRLLCLLIVGCLVWLLK
jgi:hypothetical protein